MIVSFADYANDFGYENDDWLISPELSGDEQTISFYARTASTSKRNDYIQVRYSTTGTATSDFTLLPDGEIRLENGWTRYEYTLPAGTRYFAIRNNSEEGFAVLLDDITYTIAGDAPQVTLLGYDIYCDGELLNDEPISETTFTIDGAAPGNYWVTAVYDAGVAECTVAHDAGVAGDTGADTDSAAAKRPRPECGLHDGIIRHDISAADTRD